VCERLWVSEIVHGDEIQILVRQGSTKNVTSDASETINANLYGHVASEEFVLLKNARRSPKQPSMVTGRRSQRKRHGVHWCKDVFPESGQRLPHRATLQRHKWADFRTRARLPKLLPVDFERTDNVKIL
jgi:hypothetical protein